MYVCNVRILVFRITRGLRNRVTTCASMTSGQSLKKRKGQVDDEENEEETIQSWHA